MRALRLNCALIGRANHTVEPDLIKSENLLHDRGRRRIVFGLRVANNVFVLTSERRRVAGGVQ